VASVETRRLLADAEAMRLRERAKLAARLAGQGDTTDAERKRLRWYVDHYGQAADRFSP
jgi:hypothetical protein